MAVTLVAYGGIKDNGAPNPTLVAYPGGGAFAGALAGDWMVTWTFNDDSSTASTLPAGFTAIDSGSGASASAAYGKKKCTGGETSPGAPTNTSPDLQMTLLFRGASDIVLLGESIASTNPPTVPGGTLTVIDGTSVVGAFLGRRTQTGIFSTATPPTGMSIVQTLETTVSGVSCNSVSYITAGVSSFAGGGVTVAGSAAGYVGHSFEVVAALVVAPSGASLTVTGGTATVTVSDNQAVTPTGATLAITASPPAVTASNNQAVTPTGAALTLSGSAPTVTATDHKSVTPAGAALTATGSAPTVTASDNRTVTPGGAALTITGGVPTATATAHQSVTPSGAALALTGSAPSVTVGDAQAITPAPATLSVVGGAATVAVTDHQTVTPTGVSLTITGSAPLVLAPLYVIPAPADLALTGGVAVVAVLTMSTGVVDANRTYDVRAASWVADIRVTSRAADVAAASRFADVALASRVADVRVASRVADVRGARRIEDV